MGIGSHPQLKCRVNIDMPCSTDPVKTKILAKLALLERKFCTGAHVRKYRRGAPVNFSPAREVLIMISIHLATMKSTVINHKIIAAESSKLPKSTLSESSRIYI